MGYNSVADIIMGLSSFV